MTSHVEDGAWEWPDSLDALVAAPAFHTLVLENSAVRVLDTRIGPGETVPLHTHRWPAVLYVLTGGHFVRRDHRSAILADTRLGEPIVSGAALRTPRLPPHTLENVDTGEIRVLNFELKGHDGSHADAERAVAEAQERADA